MKTNPLRPDDEDNGDAAGTPGGSGASAAAPPAEASLLVRVRGRVQGVGFREACVRRAHALGVAGWVRNRSDGSVEAMFQGLPERLDALCDWLCDGVPAARVDDIHVTPMQPPVQRCDGFECLPTV